MEFFEVFLVSFSITILVQYIIFRKKFFDKVLFNQKDENEANDGLTLYTASNMNQFTDTTFVNYSWNEFKQYVELASKMISFESFKIQNRQIKNMSQLGIRKLKRSIDVELLLDQIEDFLPSYFSQFNLRHEMITPVIVEIFSNIFKDLLERYEFKVHFCEYEHGNEQICIYIWYNRPVKELMRKFRGVCRTIGLLMLDRNGTIKNEFKTAVTPQNQVRRRLNLRVQSNDATGQSNVNSTISTKSTPKRRTGFI